jgi:hypothetical protein
VAVVEELATASVSGIELIAAWAYYDLGPHRQIQPRRAQCSQFLSSQMRLNHSPT